MRRESSKLTRRRSKTVLAVCIFAIACAFYAIFLQGHHNSFIELAAESRQDVRSPTSPPAGGRQIGNEALHSSPLPRMPDPSKSLSRIFFITVQTSPTPTWCRMLLSAALSGNISIINLAWGAKYAHIKRPQWILHFLNTLRPEDVVVFADGGDTLYTGVPPESIHQRFSSMTAESPQTHSIDDVLHGIQLSPVLFNAEANCYHQQTFDGSWGVKKGKCLSAYKRYDPNITSPYRYLNGGGWIARVWAAQKVFGAAVDIIKAGSHWWCDQSVIGGLLLSGKLRGTLGLDTRNKFFLPTYHLRPLRDFCTSTVPPGGLNSANPKLLPDLLRMCHSGEVPSILHFNGKSEGRFTSDIIHRTGWFSRLQQQQSLNENDHPFHMAKKTPTFLGTLGKSVAVGDVCPALVPPR